MFLAALISDVKSVQNRNFTIDKCRCIKFGNWYFIDASIWSRSQPFISDFIHTFVYNMILENFVSLGTETSYSCEYTTVEPMTFAPTTEPNTFAPTTEPTIFAPATTGPASIEPTTIEPTISGPVTTESSDVTTGSEQPDGTLNPSTIELHHSDVSTNLGYDASTVAGRWY